MPLKSAEWGISLFYSDLGKEEKRNCFALRSPLNSKAKSIPLDTLERICLTLDCEIGDLLVLVKCA
ncbi:MAG: helix-turn-helix domain-containing protein [Nostoc sp.]|uniref:helix-turn-helix domain-containing protein n=1 Tax=Nostoc sp. TaxID=1180 RepID=UPI002FF4A4D2